MRKIRIIIVDSGVRLDHPAVHDHHPIVVRYSGLREGEGDCGHGTAIYNIVKKQKALLILSIFKLQIRMEKSVRKTAMSNPIHMMSLTDWSLKQMVAKPFLIPMIIGEIETI